MTTPTTPAPAAAGGAPFTAPITAPFGAQFGASLDVMAQTAAHVRGVNEDIGALLGTLMSQLEPIASTWKGAASTAFQQLHQRWNADARKLNAALGGIAESLVATHRTYVASEDASTAAVGRVAGLING